MIRLLEAVGDDHASAGWIVLLRGAAATRPTPAARRRVWTALQRRSERRGTGVFGMPVMKVVVAGVTLVALAGTVGAAVGVMMRGSRWIAPLLRRSRPAPSEAPDAHFDGYNPRRRTAVTRSSETVPQQPPSISEPASAPPAGLTGAGPVRMVGTHGAARVHVPARPAASAGQAHTQVLDALVALRRDHEPVRAGALLDRYLAAHARGALREEALALAIEAADARDDRAVARRFAVTYLAEYPRGRFRQFARSHGIDAAPSGTRPAPPTE